MRELKVDLRATPAIFIGGGAALFRNFSKAPPMVAHAGTSPDQRANAIGYGMLGCSSAGAGCRPITEEGMVLFADNKYRYSLQWDAFSEEQDPRRAADGTTRQP